MSYFLGGVTVQLKQFDDRNLEPVSCGASRHVLDGVSPMDVLAELVSLLDEYAPSWYSEAQDERAHAALRMVRGA
jgi:hypothetical protein